MALTQTEIGLLRQIADLAKEKGIDASIAKASGPCGRIIEKDIIKLYDKLPQNQSSFVYSTQEEILRVKVGCDDVIKDVNGDTSWMKEEFKIKYNHIVKCINAWKKSLENASDAIKKDIEIKEQEVIEKIHQESVPKFGLG